MANKPQKELGGPRKMSLGTKVIIGIFAVVMALSMTLPSLTQIFAGSRSESSSSEQESDQSSSEQESNTTPEGENKDESSDGAKKEEEAKDDGIANVPNNESLKSLADQNKKDVEKFSKRLEEDPNNLAALLNLAQTYMTWGGSATYSGTTDEEKAYTKGLLTKAMGYYDQYLKLHESDAAKVQRIMCESYAGDTEKAVSELEKMTQEKPEYPVAWVYLGMLYMQQGEKDKALEAYNKVAEVDPDDNYGMQSYAEQSIASANASSTSFEDLTNEKLLGTKSEPEEGLPGVIAQHSNVANQGGPSIQTIG